MRPSWTTATEATATTAKKDDALEQSANLPAPEIIAQ